MSLATMRATSKLKIRLLGAERTGEVSIALPILPSNSNRTNKKSESFPIRFF
jgi:hypothetical protein